MIIKDIDQGVVEISTRLSTVSPATWSYDSNYLLEDEKAKKEQDLLQQVMDLEMFINDFTEALYPIRHTDAVKTRATLKIAELLVGTINIDIKPGSRKEMLLVKKIQNVLYLIADLIENLLLFSEEDMNLTFGEFITRLNKYKSAKDEEHLIAGDFEYSDFV
ncbi:MAG: hypothetical protein C0594_16170 [Marinilabiliales bacterium]|nr:MAG: hypothetical protein C0594_16170 [Marinilabiliales bacterium]